LNRGLGADRILHEPLVTLRAKVIASSLINVIPNEVTLKVLGPFEDLVNLQQMVPIVVNFISVHRIHHGLDFQSDHVAQVLHGIENPFTSVASIMNHHPVLSVK
jgi:hypothetical protein